MVKLCLIGCGRQTSPAPALQKLVQEGVPLVDAMRRGAPLHPNLEQQRQSVAIGELLTMRQTHYAREVHTG